MTRVGSRESPVPLDLPNLHPFCCQYIKIQLAELSSNKAISWDGERDRKLAKTTVISEGKRRNLGVRLPRQTGFYQLMAE